MKMVRPSFTLSFRIVLLIAATSIPQWDCKKDNPVDNSTIDSNLVGVWYNRSDTVGFELLSDGTMNTLDVDSVGILRYALIDTINGALILKTESARSGAISIRGSYKSHTLDSTYVATGTYSFSNNFNTLTLTLLLPLNGSSQATFVYTRSSIGAKVVSGSSISRGEGTSSMGSKRRIGRNDGGISLSG
jgi:hypothetical protein